MNNLIDILIWLNKPKNRKRLNDFEMDYIANSITKCVQEINPIIQAIEKENKLLIFIKSLKGKRD